MKISFQKHITWRYCLSTSKRRVLTEPYEFSVNGTRYVILEGFWSDSASIPRLAWSLIGSPFTGRYVCPSLIHDCLYACQPMDIDREDADNIFYQAMLDSGVGHLKAWLMYHAVRVFGGFAWDKKTSMQIIGASKHLLVS